MTPDGQLRSRLTMPQSENRFLPGVDIGRHFSSLNGEVRAKNTEV